MYLLRGDVPRPVRTVRGDKEWEANCCLYVGFPLLIPPDLVNRSTSPCRGTTRIADQDAAYRGSESGPIARLAFFSLTAVGILAVLLVLSVMPETRPPPDADEPAPAPAQRPKAAAQAPV